MGTFEQDKYAAHRAAVKRTRVSIQKWALIDSGYVFAYDSLDARRVQQLIADAPLLLALAEEHPAMAWRKTSAQGAIDALRDGKQVRDEGGWTWEISPGLEFTCVGRPGPSYGAAPFGEAQSRLLAGKGEWQVPA